MINASPIISVLLPVYNGMAYLGLSVESDPGGRRWGIIYNMNSAFQINFLK